MDALKAIMNRKVARSFAARDVSLEDLQTVIDAGRRAMSARNTQPWQFIIVRDRARLRELGALSPTGRFIADAPSAVVVLKDLNNARWADIDCAHAVQNMANAAWALGLGTCWVGNFDAEKISSMLAIPQGSGIFTILPFGYPDPKSPPQARPLKPRREMVFYERYGCSVPDGC
jgi:nitroreductase